MVSWNRHNKTVTTILDFIELSKFHLGRNMAEALVATLNRYGIAHKVSSFLKEKQSLLYITRLAPLQLITPLITTP